jgi:hypothetical protein
MESIEDAYNQVIELKLQLIHLAAKLEQLERRYGTEAEAVPEVSGDSEHTGAYP